MTESQERMVTMDKMEATAVMAKCSRVLSLTSRASSVRLEPQETREPQDKKDLVDRRVNQEREAKTETREHLDSRVHSDSRAHRDSLDHQDQKDSPDVSFKLTALLVPRDRPDHLDQSERRESQARMEPTSAVWLVLPETMEALDQLDSLDPSVLLAPLDHLASLAAANTALRLAHHQATRWLTAAAAIWATKKITTIWTDK